MRASRTAHPQQATRLPRTRPTRPPPRIPRRRPPPHQARPRPKARPPRPAPTPHRPLGQRHRHGHGRPSPSESGGQAPVLRLGDKGSEVVELQLRLKQIGYYDGKADGDYDSEVQSAVRGYQLTRVILSDESGVYGHATRTSLESETSEP
ncbi:peptidoglycan-binding domain-containing protein [Streptomyces sp. CA-249302]|uniref:peptidoglycan-binding domain-containing protein n=1 Tax=Streptomyces sp. CA-249302 TaxID=3240058 RepID=UPI003D8E9A76